MEPKSDILDRVLSLILDVENYRDWDTSDPSNWEPMARSLGAILTYVKHSTPGESDGI